MLVLKFGVVGDIDGLEDMAEGQINEFLSDMIEMRKRRKGRRLGRGVGGGKCAASGDHADDADEDSKKMSTKFEELCEEDKILVFFKRLLNEWKQELDDMTEPGERMVARFNQCAEDLNPLFDLCRKKVLSDDIRQALLLILESCMKRDYLAASEEYIKLAIGNSPWPIGVTMVGIHERSAREKIHANSIAHIMNDETTRRYLQSIKRLVTVSQPSYAGQP